MAYVKLIKIDFTPEQALRRAMSVQAPEHDPPAPKRKVKSKAAKLQVDSKRLGTKLRVVAADGKLSGPYAKRKAAKRRKG
jgi:hypothetical protein